jgi:hypothetical protein
MRDAERYLELERALARLLTAADPVAALRAARATPAADPALHAVEEDGLRIAALLVVKLRFERLINGSRLANEWFERDGRAFTEAFRAYHLAVPLLAADPWQEAEAFERWLDRSDREVR